MEQLMDIADIKNSSHQHVHPSHPKNFWQDFREWIKVIVIALAIALPVRYFIAEPFIVSGASMDPTFSTNQFLIVDRLSYHFSEPKRGDVIIFEYPNNPSIYYIKRIIGLPNESIDIQDDTVTITDAKGQKIKPDQSYVNPIHAWHGSFHASIGDHEYFVMGDNRAESSDSRIWGLLDKKFIIGRPFVRLFPLSTLSFWPGEHTE